jgi:hypothetical protein
LSRAYSNFCCTLYGSVCFINLFMHCKKNSKHMGNRPDHPSYMMYVADKASYIYIYIYIWKNKIAVCLSTMPWRYIGDTEIKLHWL